MIRQISKRQFDAYCYSRQPYVRSYAQEIAWFEAGDRKLLGLVVYDLIDEDYGHVILGRDSRNLFRWIDGGTEFFRTPSEAADDLKKMLTPYLEDGNSHYPQGDEHTPPNEIFTPVVPEEQLHPYFKILKDESRFEAARNIIKEIAYSFIDVDGNYLQQFQTNGFDARLWELYLHVFLYNDGFEMDRSHSAPDYCLNKYGYKCFLEAVTVGPNEEFDEPNALDAKDIIELSKDYIPIKFGSALFSKINRSPQYWELNHVRGHPFILAVHDYHKPAGDLMPGSMTWSRAGLANYLYGVRDEVEFDAEGRIRSVLVAPAVVPTVKQIKTNFHQFKHKRIPSRFFWQPNTENISAVLYSNGATLTTFNRMGKLAGLGSKDVTMVRRGMKMSYKNGEFRPVPFAQNVDSPDYEESWGDTVVMYHNPNALYPVDPEAFPSITHVQYDEASDEFLSIPNANEVFSSVTFVLTVSSENDSFSQAQNELLPD